jgi:hypothetical protein
MDTRVAKITRSLTSPIISSSNPFLPPALTAGASGVLELHPNLAISRTGSVSLGSSRRSPPGAQNDVFLIVSKPGRPDGRHRIPFLRQYFLIATENLIDAGDTSVQNSWIARGALAGCIMEHRGVRYELRRALGNDEWVWTVYTPAPKQGNVSGDRYFAMQRAMSVIDRWCGRNAESVPPQATQEASMGRHERLSGRG